MPAEQVPEYIQGLLRPQAFPHTADDLRLEETHISWVVLAGLYAYKLKKPINLGFLDFSTQDARAADCAEEVRLNRRLCPDVYLGVVHVVERHGGYAIGGRGRRVEPAVHMRRLPVEGMLPSLLARGVVDARLMRGLARHLARFHTRAATGPGVDEYGGLSTVRANWEENFVQTEPFVGRSLPTAVKQKTAAYVERFLRGQAALLRQRIAQGRIRDGHGDLHAASICVEGRRLQLFDCVEFAPRFRCADVAAEVGFLAMDLAHRGRADLADAFVDAYVQASGDGQLTRLLDFYCCYRAFVRGKVLSLRLVQSDLPEGEATHIESEARAYFDLAWAYAGGLGGPTLIVTLGLPASGKSTLAEGLAGRLGLVHVSSDLVRKELAGVHPTEHLAERFGEGAYSPSMTRRTYAALRRRAARWLRRGRSVVLDATFGQPQERAAVRRLAARANARLVVLHCRADEATLRDRLAARSDRAKTGASDARLELWPALKAAFSEPTELAGVQTLDTCKPSEETLADALAALQGGLAQAVVW